MNYVQEYYDKIVSGEIVAGRRVKKQYEKMVNDMSRPLMTTFYFDEAAGARPIDFIEMFCKQSEGNFGAEIKLELFQKAWVQALFGFKWKDTDLRRYNESFFMVGRKNGKTTLLSGLALYMLIADGEGAAEIYCVASKKDQAKKAFNSAAAMRFHSKSISLVTKKRRTDIYMPSTLSQFEALASDSDTLDGLNAHLVIIDELHAIKDRALYEVMKQSMGSRLQSMLIMITTAGTNRENIFDDTYDYACKVCDGMIKNDKYLPIIYELDDREEWTNRDMWLKANPGLGTIKTIDYMIEMVQRAQDDKKMLKTVLTKDFNIRETDTESWLHLDEIENSKTFKLEDFKGIYAVGGVDLSSTTDLTCGTLFFKRNGIGYVVQKYFMPNTIERRAREDKVPYDIWLNDGWIHESPDVKIDYSAVTAWFVKMRDVYEINPLWIGYDSWSAQYWADQMANEGFNMERVIQGAQTMSQPMKELEAELKAHRIVYNCNPVLEWCLTNTTIKTDENDNIRPVKGRSQRRRIDGAVSLIDAYVIYMSHLADYHAWNGEE